LKNTLIVVQVTVSVLLLAATGLAVRALASARETDVGVDVERVAMLETDARYAGYPPEAVQGVYEELLRRIEAIPGVESAVLADGPPAGGGVHMRYRPLVIDGYAPSSGDEEASRVATALAGPGYFETLGIQLLRGRTFDEGDRADAAPVAVVNETMARRYFGTVEAVGRRFSFEGEPAAPVTIIGVVRDVRTDMMEMPEPLFYRSFRQVEDPTPTVLARTALDPSTVVGAMQSALREMGSGLPVVTAKTLERHVDDSLLAIKAAAAALAGLSLAGLGLACLGLHAVVSFAVSRRSRELGIRVALGARSAQVVRLVAREVTGLVGAGIALGLALTWVVMLVISAVAVDLSASPHIDVSGPQADPLTFLLVAVVIVLAALAAAYFPARRAANVDPLVALRHQ
jgi:predicted permease